MSSINIDFSVRSKIFSARAECVVDINNVVYKLDKMKAGLVLVKKEDLYEKPGILSGEVNAEFRFGTPFGYQQFLDVISSVEDAHVIHQTLLPVPADQNNMERDYDRPFK